MIHDALHSTPFVLVMQVMPVAQRLLWVMHVQQPTAQVVCHTVPTFHVGVKPNNVAK
jgi:hypothetical protein